MKPKLGQWTQVHRLPRGTFQGSNFMTPTVEAYYKGTLRGRTVYVEVSSGSGMFGGTIYGLSVRLAGGDRLDPDPSVGGFPREELEERLEGLE